MECVHRCGRAVSMLDFYNDQSASLGCGEEVCSVELCPLERSEQLLEKDVESFMTTLEMHSSINVCCEINQFSIN